MNKLSYDKFNLFEKVFICLLLLLLFMNVNSFVTFFLYMLLVLFSLFNNKYYISYILIGAGNYLPIVYGMSPLLISMISMSMYLFKSILKQKLIKKPKYLNDFFLLLVFMSIVGCINGIFNNDLSFGIDIFMIMVFLYISYIFIFNGCIEINEIIKYLIFGISTGIIFSFLIKLGIIGSLNAYTGRLSVGDRADPNSSGLLFGILSVYYFITLFDNINKRKKIKLINVIMQTLSLFCLFLTQSRGSLLCMVITCILFIFMRKKENNESSAIGFFRIIGIFVFLVAVSFIFSSITNLILSSWNEFLYRIQNPASQDGERLFLLEMSFKSFLQNPITGNSIQNFKVFAGHIPHNSFSDFMVTNGIFGILFYIFFFAFPLFKIFKVRKKGEIKISFYIYLECFFNMFFYSASCEKIAYFLLLLFLLNYRLEGVTKYEKDYVTRSN